MKQEKKKWGGQRKGSGRPKKPPTKTLSYRVPADQAAQLDKQIRAIIKKPSLERPRKDT